MDRKSPENNEMIKDSVELLTNLRANRLRFRSLITATVHPPFVSLLSEMRNHFLTFPDSANRC